MSRFVPDPPPAGSDRSHHCDRSLGRDTPDDDDRADRSDGSDRFEDWRDDSDDSESWVPIRRRRPAAPGDPRLVREGRSGRSVADVDRLEPADPEPPGPDRSIAADRAASPPESPLSSYDVAARGPRPVPDWLVTSLSARDTPLGTVKSGKEADVSLLDRSLPGGPGCLLAVKTYRDSRHRMFHRDIGYQEGRRTRRSRETRAMAARTSFGRELLAGRWATAEFAALSTMWQAGARVPYPVQILGTELMMEFIGEPDGRAAPRLAAFDGDTDDFVELWHDLVQSLEQFADHGLTHGDLSAYNVLVRDGTCVVIDLPQVVDVVANPQGPAFLERDCARIADFFSRRGVRSADGERLAAHLGSLANR